VSAPALAQMDKVRFSLNPQIYSYLPLFLAVDKGYFKEQRIEVDIVPHGGSALAMLPILARGDLDLSVMVAAPGFFNQHNEGFGIKLIASVASPKQGWHDTGWIMVRKDLWDSGAVKTLADLKGKVFEGGPKGSPVYLITIEAIRQSGLAPTDVTLSGRLRAVADALALFQNKGVDLLTSVEPIASRLQEEGLAVRWKPGWEIIPWFQETYIAANPDYLKKNRDVAKRFLAAFLKGAQEVTAAKGQWTPDMIASVVKWSKFPESVIKSIPGPQNPSQLGIIDEKSLETAQGIWMKEGLVKDKRPIADMVDTSLIQEVRKQLGID
jgi:NitT/TauT family transport system substrate-binding protein